MNENLSMSGAGAGGTDPAGPELIDLILRINRRGFEITFKPERDQYGVLNGFLVFAKMEPAEAPVKGWAAIPIPPESPSMAFGWIESPAPAEAPRTPAEQFADLRRRIPPDRLYWRIDLYRPETVARAVRRFYDLFLAEADG